MPLKCFRMRRTSENMRGDSACWSSAQVSTVVVRKYLYLNYSLLSQLIVGPEWIVLPKAFCTRVGILKQTDRVHYVGIPC